MEVVSNLTINGVRSGNTEFTFDGTPSMWGTNAAFAPPTELVAEFKVQTATYDASLGRSPGGSINVVLRSGANQPHVALYWFHNNQHLQSLDVFHRQALYNPATGPVTDAKIASVNPRNILNRFGATFSGPVVVPKVYDGRNKTFWIFSFEGLTRPGVERGNTFFTVPTLPERQGDFSALVKLGANYQIYDPFTTTPAAGGRLTRLPLRGISSRRAAWQRRRSACSNTGRPQTRPALLTDSTTTSGFRHPGTNTGRTRKKSTTASTRNTGCSAATRSGSSCSAQDRPSIIRATEVTATGITTGVLWTMCT